MQVNEHVLASISPYLIISLRGVTNPYSFKRLSSYLKMFLVDIIWILQSIKSFE